MKKSRDLSTLIEEIRQYIPLQLSWKVEEEWITAHLNIYFYAENDIGVYYTYYTGSFIPQHITSESKATLEEALQNMRNLLIRTERIADGYPLQSQELNRK
ncbi:MAG: hypothetical protein AAFY70_15845 [Bacteroidota bacterium]